MNWAILISAGLVEVAWSQSIKPTQNFTRPIPTLLCFALGASSVYLLTLAMATIPTGTAYAVFTGIGAVGAITLGIVVQHDPAGVARLGALALIIGGIVLAHTTSVP